MEPPALPPCRPLPPPAPAERAGTGAQPARHGGCCHTGAATRVPCAGVKSLQGTQDTHSPVMFLILLFSPNFGSPSPDTPPNTLGAALRGEERSDLFP